MRKPKGKRFSASDAGTAIKADRKEKGTPSLIQSLRTGYGRGYDQTKKYLKDKARSL